MAVKVVESAKSGLVSLIQVVLLFAVLVATVVFAKASPDLFQTVITKLGTATAGVIIWLCDQVIANTPQS